MPLPDTYASLSAFSLYQDKIQVNFQVEPIVASETMRAALYRRGFRTSGPSLWTGNLRRVVGLPELDGNFPVRISRPKPEAPINCFVDINPLHCWHSQRTNFDPEISSDGHTNWMHADDIGEDNCALWEWVDVQIRTLRGHIELLFAHLSEDSARPRQPRVIHTSISSVEICIDVQTPNPRAMVAAIAPTLESMFPLEAEGRTYPHARLVEQSTPTIMISAHRGKHERYKVYCKTSHRVRLECWLGAGAFKAFGMPRAIDDVDRSFVRFFGACVSHCLPYLASLLASSRDTFNLDNSCNIYSLISIFAGIKRPVRLREFLDQLLTTGSIRNSFDRQLVERLKSLRPPVLSASSVRGRSVIAPYYIRAAWQLREAHTSFSEGSHRLQSISRVSGHTPVEGRSERSGETSDDEGSDA